MGVVASVISVGNTVPDRVGEDETAKYDKKCQFEI